MGGGHGIGDTPLLHPDSQVECNKGEPPRTYRSDREPNKNEKVNLMSKGGIANGPIIGWGGTDVRLRKGEKAAKPNEGGEWQT